MQNHATIAHIDALPNGTRLAEFEIQGLLGIGGFGMVYRGYDHSLHRTVAIKEYMPASLVGRTPNAQVSARSGSDQLAFETGLKSFIDEARLLARFDHPSLVKVYRFWEANNTAYMAMPLYQGVTLKEARSQMAGPPPEEWLRTVLWSVAQALKVLHTGNTLHRDVSPDNIFLQDVGPPVLLDLGSARRALSEHSHKYTAVLKVNYAPIEQYGDAHNIKEGPWTDLYALAAVAHACICNTAPQPATFRLVEDQLPPLAQLAQTSHTHFGTNYGAYFCHAIDHALALQPSARPQSVDAFLKEINLTTGPDVSQFNWRQALGPGVSLGETSAANANATTIASPTAKKQVPHTAASVGVDPADTAADAAARRNRNRWQLALAGAAAVVGALALWGRGGYQAAKLPEPVPIAVPSGIVDPDGGAKHAALCANVPFYKRTWCLHQACQKPGMSKVPACSIEQKRREDAARTAQPF